MVETDKRLQLKDENAREGRAKKILEQNRTGMIEESSPEWYLMKLTKWWITPKDASGLLVSLRTHEMGCVFHCLLGPPRHVHVRVLVVDDRWYEQFFAMQLKEHQLCERFLKDKVHFQNVCAVPLWLLVTPFIISLLTWDINLEGW